MVGPLGRLIWLCNIVPFSLRTGPEIASSNSTSHTTRDFTYFHYSSLGVRAKVAIGTGTRVRMAR